MICIQFSHNVNVLVTEIVVTPPLSMILVCPVHGVPSLLDIIYILQIGGLLKDDLGCGTVGAHL